VHQTSAIGQLCDIPFSTLYTLFARWTRLGLWRRLLDRLRIPPHRFCPSPNLGTEHSPDSLYLAVLLPMLGMPLPLTKTMIALTFVVGLLPVLGNLISNTVIVVVSLSVSLLTALSSLVFLIVIHKLEYFVNARIIGARIGAHAWELLLSMLIMDACFGLPGVIAAPIYYAYLKDELSARKLI